MKLAPPNAIFYKTKLVFVYPRFVHICQKKIRLSTNKKNMTKFKILAKFNNTTGMKLFIYFKVAFYCP